MANFPPSKYLLYSLAQKLFGLNTAQLAEPVVATFCRGIVDKNNNPLLTAAQLTALAALLTAGPSSSQIVGIFPIPSGVDFVQVTGLALGFTPTKCVPTIMKLTGNLNFFATCRYDTLSADGFTADLSAITDSGTYYLSFTVA